MLVWNRNIRKGNINHSKIIRIESLLWGKGMRFRSFKTKRRLEKLCHSSLSYDKWWEEDIEWINVLKAVSLYNDSMYIVLIKPEIYCNRKLSGLPGNI